MNKPLLKGYGLSILLIAAGFILAYQFVEPAPPNQLIMATGSKTGAYHSFGLALQKVLAEDGIELELRNSDGSMENAMFIADGTVDISIIQGGTPLSKIDRGEEIRSLGSLYYEPMWLFHKINPPPQTLQQLSRFRVNKGKEGSGTLQLVNELPNLNDMTEDKFSMLGNAEASEALVAGKLDAAFIVSGEKSKDVQKLFAAKDVAIMDFPRAEAYHLHRRYLSVLKLPPGGIDMADNRPAFERSLIAVTAVLVAHEDLHPALVDLLLMASKRIVDKPWLV